MSWRGHLEPVIEIDLDNFSYEFDLFGVFLEDGKWYVQWDAGCSCPIPWEDYETVSDLVGPLTVQQVKKEIRDLTYKGNYGLPDFISAKAWAVTELEKLDKEKDGATHISAEPKLGSIHD